MALSRAKDEGKRHLPLLRGRDGCAGQARRKIEIDLRDAIENDGLRAHYQPLVDLSTGRITGFEALVRWPHPERGMISPAEFIPVAEETGLIKPLGRLMLRRACMDAAQWPDDVRVAVNLSPLQFRVGNLLSLVMDALKHSGLPAQKAGARDHRDAAAGKERARCWRPCTRCARSASASRWTISAPAIRQLELSAEFSVRQDQDRPSFVRGLDANRDAPCATSWTLRKA